MSSYLPPSSQALSLAGKPAATIRRDHLIAVASGKGGVGKTFSLSLLAMRSPVAVIVFCCSMVIWA